MNTRNTLLCAPLLAALLPGGTAVAQQTHPNILLILADDYGWNDVGCMGSTYYETPNIDRIAAQGVRFTNGYAACQVSSPSRASILTGQYTPRHGITDWIGERAGEEWRKTGRHSKLLPALYEESLDLRQTTLAEALTEEGYTTFIAGKWHLGGEGSDPEDHGFQINIGGWQAGSPKGGYFSPYSNPKLKDGPRGENLSMRLANETVDFLAHQNEKPFFVYLSFYAVHGPIQTTQERWSYFRDKAERAGIAPTGFEVDRMLPVRKHQDSPVYAGLIQQMDDAIGRVLDYLQESGLDRNTLVIFTSDNGGVVSGDSYATSLAPLRGGKGRQWEGGIRVPFIISYPGLKQKGSTCDEPVIGTDLYPTILDYAGLPLRPKQHLDGVSLIPVLEQGTHYDRALFWHYPHYGNQGGEPSSIIRKGNWKLIFYHEDGRCELYNLEKDITESNPLNAQYPKKVTELKRELDAWLQSVNARMPEADMEYDPVAEKRFRDSLNRAQMEKLEAKRLEELSKGWKPNKDWWGSTVD